MEKKDGGLELIYKTVVNERWLLENTSDKRSKLVWTFEFVFIMSVSFAAILFGVIFLQLNFTTFEQNPEILSWGTPIFCFASLIFARYWRIRKIRNSWEAKRQFRTFMESYIRDLNKAISSEKPGKLKSFVETQKDNLLNLARMKSITLNPYRDRVRPVEDKEAIEHPILTEPQSNTRTIDTEKIANHSVLTENGHTTA